MEARENMEENGLPNKKKKKKAAGIIISPSGSVQNNWGGHSAQWRGEVDNEGKPWRGGKNLCYLLIEFSVRENRT